MLSECGVQEYPLFIVRVNHRPKPTVLNHRHGPLQAGHRCVSVWINDENPGVHG